MLQVVRCFGDTGGKHAPDAAAGERSLIGWHLRREVLDFLAVTGAGIDVDEYAMGGGEEQG